MPRRKRSYVPKQKGCHECSKRRINCDRTEPACRKCQDKGIACSGFGIRYRFVDETTSEPDPAYGAAEDLRVGPAQNDRGDTELLQDTSKDTVGGIDLDENDSESGSADEYVQCCPDDTTQDIPRITHENSGPRALFTNTRSFDHTVGESNVQAEPFILSKEDTLEYFSQKIAGEMVVVDDEQNGWRYLVLPTAHLDELVMDAVLSASTFHYQLNIGDTVHEPNLHYMRAIRKLQQRQDLAACSTEEAQNVLLAIIVLLVTVMINASSDFPMILKLLQLALNAVGGGKELFKGDLGTFLERQIKTIRAHAAPFLSRSEGRTTLASEGPRWIECFEHYSRLYANNASQFSVLADLELQGQNIYLQRVTVGNDAPPFLELVDKFKSTLSLVPNGSVGEHTLVWATFMAASESSTLEHQQYFRQRLLGHYHRNGFMNICKVVEHLEQVWSRQGVKDWTALLPEPHVFVV